MEGNESNVAIGAYLGRFVFFHVMLQSCIFMDCFLWTRLLGDLSLKFNTTVLWVGTYCPMRRSGCEKLLHPEIL